MKPFDDAVAVDNNNEDSCLICWNFRF